MKKVRDDIYKDIITAKNYVTDLIDKDGMYDILKYGDSLIRSGLHKDYNFYTALRAVLDIGTFYNVSPLGISAARKYDIAGFASFMMPSTADVCDYFGRAKKLNRKGVRFNPTIWDNWN